MEMGYLMVLYGRLGAKIGDLHAKDSYSFCNRLMHFKVNVLYKRVAPQNPTKIAIF